MPVNRPVQVELVGRKIRQLRRQRKLTQVELAEKIGIHQSDLSRMEKGEYKVGLDTLLRILGMFNLGIGEFFEERPKEQGFLDKYRSLTTDARKEVDQFISFKSMQDEEVFDDESDGEEGS